jgi:hypothetical protein
MDVEQIRALALALPEVTEAPHHAFASFRVAGRIFITLPPDGRHAHLFVSESQREQALALHPTWVEPLLWGQKIAGVRVVLKRAKQPLVALLVRQAWAFKAPRRLASVPAATGR